MGLKMKSSGAFGLTGRKQAGQLLLGAGWQVKICGPHVNVIRPERTN
jgi:hypothetical protein